MSWNAALPMDSSLIRLSAAMIRGNELATQNVISSSSLIGNLPFVPFTTSPTPAPVWFYLDAAPSGWTILAGTPTDALIAIKGGSSAYNVTGGTTVGTWNGPAYTLQIADIPAHTHDFYTYKAGSGNNAPQAAGVAQQFAIPTSSVGGGGAHEHDWTSTRPMGSVGILCTKTA